MLSRTVDKEIELIKYYPNYKTALVWYQDLELCKQVEFTNVLLQKVLSIAESVKSFLVRI